MATFSCGWISFQIVFLEIFLDAVPFWQMLLIVISSVEMFSGVFFGEKGGRTGWDPLQLALGSARFEFSLKMWSYRI